MNLGRNDLTIERTNGDAYGYVVLAQAQVQSPPSVIHTKRQPEIPLNVGSGTPTDPGGQYDVRDSNGEKAIVHYDWHLGAGQDSLDYEGASASKYKYSKNIDVGTTGKMKLSRSLELTSVQGAVGPVFYALGVWWLPCLNGVLRHSLDLVTWTASTYKTGDENYDPIYDMCTDGTKVYFSVSSGSGVGVYAGDPTTYEFSQISTQATFHIAYLNGMLFGTTATGAGHFDPTTYAYTEDTMVFMSANTSIGLSVAGNMVYWVVSQGGQCYLYSLYWDAETDTVLAQQQAEFRSGFTATCSVGYLNSVYIGGYLTSPDINVGRGAIYMYVNGSAQPLTTIGTNPDDVFISEDSGVYTYSVGVDTLDNKVFALGAGEDKLYIQCSRGFYIWDIDDGGYHHIAEFSSPEVSDVEGGGVQDVFVGLVFDWNSFQSSEEYYQSLASAGVTYGAGKYVGVYSNPYPELVITNTLAAPTVITTWSDYPAGSGFVSDAFADECFLSGDDESYTVDHLLVPGDIIVINDSNSDPDIDGVWIVGTTPTSDTFTIKDPTTGVAVDVDTTAGTGGTMNHDDSGVAYRSNDYNLSGSIESSVSSYHTGSITKEFRQIKVAHGVLATGQSIRAAYNIDGGGWTEAVAATTSTNSTTYSIDALGYEIAVRITLMGDGETTPVVTAVNVIWDFERVDRHQYTLDCRTGAANSRWTESPLVAIPHIWAAGNERALFNDRFIGEYYGVIEQAEFQQAAQSEKEGASGVVTLLVREVD